MRSMSGVTSLINPNPASEPSTKPCYIPAVWANMGAKAANPAGQNASLQ